MLLFFLVFICKLFVAAQLFFKVAKACLPADIEQAPTTVKSDGTRPRHTHQMSCLVLPCGCTMQWDEEETTIVFCSRHTIDYLRWEGSDRDFVKNIATPPRIDRKPMAELQ